MSAMAIPFERRVSSAAQWARRLSGFSLVLACTASIAHRYGFVDTIPFVWVLVLVLAFAVLGLLLAVIGFARLWFRGDKAGKASLAAVLMSCVVLAPFGLTAYLWGTHPALHDISTDLTEPPHFAVAQRSRTAEMNSIVPLAAGAAALQKEAYPDIAGRRFDASMDRVLAAAEAVMADRGWRSLSPFPSDLSEGGEVSIEMSAPTLLLRFPADAVLRLTDEGESTFVDMRLNSRYGQHDLGGNARRIRSFMNDLDAEFTRQSLSIIDIPASGEGEDAVQ